jgi:hypothetical protein
MPGLRVSVPPWPVEVANGKAGGMIAPTGSGFGQQFLDCCLQVWKFSFNGNPDKGQVNTEVIVRQSVAHSRDAAPRDFRATLLRVHGQVLDRLAKDFELPDERGTHRLSAKTSFQLELH